MKKIGFDSAKYIRLQSEKIRERIEQFGGKLYLEFGGKLFDDYHASRVLPGFAPDNKIKMLLELKDQAEIVIAINANDIEKNKHRGDLGITYDTDVMRLIDVFRGFGLYVGSIALTQFADQPSAVIFEKRMTALGLRVYRHYVIPNYPSDLRLVVSDDGYGRNDYIETTRSLVVVTAPGPGSGKMATCLSQLYHEHKRGVKAGYAKFETFPIWNLPLKHPVNLAYEAATADLNDVNMIDPFHLEAYGLTTVNYNRDIEIFPVLRTIFERIDGKCPYKSPTDMGVNMVGFSIVDDEACCEASRQEVIRRYFKAACLRRQGLSGGEELHKIELLMSTLGIEPEMHDVVPAALEVAKRTGKPAAAIGLPDGSVVTGRTTDLFGPSSAAMLNALKALAGIDDAVNLISPTVIGTIQTLKTDYMKSQNPRLHTDEMLVALAISAASDENAMRAMQKLGELSGCDVHSTVILSTVDDSVFKRLGMNVTCEPSYEKNNLYHK
ncbi:MAG: DUF1846 domain-containing protein [Clostridia bacterium]|nr:DUF1846 domain-containing protein [Clostridia bacterium]